MMHRISLGEKGEEERFFFGDFRKLFVPLSNVAFKKYGDKAGPWCQGPRPGPLRLPK
jgi:hypothetical protein